MKEAIYKLFAAAFTVVFFWGTLHAMSVLGDLSDYSYAARAAEKNSGLAAAGHDIPAVPDTYAEEMRTEPAPVADEELSHIYIDGIRFDFPVTLADIREHFETRKFAAGFDEKTSVYTGKEILLKNGIGTYMISYRSDVKKPSPEECTVRAISCPSDNYSDKYFPRITAAGIDIFRAPQEEILRLTALDREEYLAKNAVISQQGDGYVVLNLDSPSIAYYRKDIPEDMAAIDRLYPLLIATELRLPENYDADDVPENKEELREFALEYYAYDENDTSLYSYTDYKKEIEATVKDVYLTAYEFLAAPYDGHNALYYELTDIERLAGYDPDGAYYNTGYLEITARCYIEDYDGSVQTKMLLKAGDRLGDALIIHIDI